MTVLKDVAVYEFHNSNYTGFKYIKMPENHYVYENKVDKNRLLVAQGLSYPYNDFDEIQRVYCECESDNMPVITIHDRSVNEYVSQEMC